MLSVFSLLPSSCVVNPVLGLEVSRDSKGGSDTDSWGRQLTYSRHRHKLYLKGYVTLTVGVLMACLLCQALMGLPSCHPPLMPLTVHLTNGGGMKTKQQRGIVLKTLDVLI